jgi:hypothetical protein
VGRGKKFGRVENFCQEPAVDDNEKLLTILDRVDLRILDSDDMCVDCLINHWKLEVINGYAVPRDVVR